MATDGNKLVVFGSQLIGVIIVFAGLFNQHVELRSPRPKGGKGQSEMEPDKVGNRFAHLWEDPFDKEMAPFHLVSATNIQLVGEGPAEEPQVSPSPAQREPAVAGPKKSPTKPGPADRVKPTENPSAAQVAAKVRSPEQPASLSSQTRPPPSERNQHVQLAVDIPVTAAPAASPTPGVGASATPPPAVGSTPSSSASPFPKIRYLFLWNVVDANLVPEVKERRLRARYAIVSTIAAAGYLPLRESLLSPIYGESSEDSRPVGYFETFWWAKPGKAEFHRVCVVWTPKKYMLTPEAVAAVRKYVEGADVATADGPVHIFHHGTSEDLTFYRNTHKADPQRDEMKYSFVRATISGSSDPRRPELQPLATDDILVDRLARDLTARIPALSSPGADPEKYPRIVIFTESDSRYSRAIVSELKQRLPKTRLDVYSYLRGLDGRSDESRPGKATETSGSTDADSSASKSSSLSETSFGTSQFDYIRRLASRLEGKKSRDKEMRVLAVGILGTDIYDKVLVLQAIRHELPSAIFFTTDLDALYLEPEVQSVTRNLLVASASDLDPPSPSPADDWQLPPMRDSYQTVLVKQVRQALAVHAGTATSDTPEKGSIFEIAPGKAVDLDPGNIDTAESLNPQEFLARLASPGFVIVLFGVAMVNGFLILLAVSSRRANRAASRPNENSAPMTAWAVCLIWLEAAVACAFGLYLLYQLGLGTHPLLWGEPLALGISIWPSVMIRVLAFLVALLLLVIASHSLVANERRWSDNLKTAVPSSTRVWCRAGWRLRAAWRRFHPFLDRLFDRRRRTLRIMIASTVYLLISLGLFYLWQPTVPARGPNALLIEKIVLSIGVALYMIHLVFCLELHFSALSLLRALRSCYLERHPASCSVDAKMMLNTVSDLTKVIGKTLLYPLTVLILIILSRLALFDNWVMTVSLTVTFAFGAFVLVAASAILWWEGFELKKDVMEQIGGRSRLTEKLQALDKGVFAAWYNQPIFSAILSGVAVFGSLTVAGPLLRLFLGL